MHTIHPHILHTNAPHKKTTAVDMTSGSIVWHLLAFAFPLLLGNLFQQFYNTVDVLVVGNFVGSQALAAVGSTTNIVNMLVMFFNGFSVGAGVVISQFYGAHDQKGLHLSIETSIAVTFICGVIFTIIGYSCVPFMLRLMSTPEDVLDSATTYLRIYFSGVAGLLLYNIGSGILRAVGDTKHPLMFLCFSSVLNIVLDLLFVIAFHLGIAGVAYATIIAQFLSAILVLFYLTKNDDIYRLTWKDLTIDQMILKRIMAIGLPTALQSTITSFSNVFVQSYINHFGSACMAGWGCYVKLEQFLVLPMQSIGQASTTFVGQNIGAGNITRAKKGTWVAVLISSLITFAGAVPLWIFAAPMVGMFSKEQEVLNYGVLFIHLCIFFLVFGGFNQVLAGTLRGAGDAKAPMLIMLCSFVVFRQIYLYVVTSIHNTPQIVAFGYPAGWMLCSALMTIYYLFSHWEKKLKK